jgi:hypothetical protein
MTITALSSQVWSKTWISGQKSAFALRPALYICLVFAAVIASYAHWIRTRTIFACEATLYNSDRYVSYCNASGYGDYEHGAFWFDLEPSARTFARNADVLFLGSSRTQFAFSTTATADWFSGASARYYLLGFLNWEGLTFAEQLLRQVKPKARVYVIDVEGGDFFRQWESPMAQAVIHDPAERMRYEGKRLWQHVHEPVCKVLPIFCGHQYAFFRSRATGAYDLDIGHYRPTDAPVSYDPVINEDVVKGNTAVATDFLSHLPVQKKCVILTTAPMVETKIANAKAIAAALGEDLVMPQIQGLLTFDGTHMEKMSAERWSRAFFQAAGPKIRSCLEGQQASRP